MKLRDYLDKNKIPYKKFAKQIGMHYSTLLHVLGQRRKIPQVFWQKIVEATNGEISYEDLYFVVPKKNPTLKH